MNLNTRIAEMEGMGRRERVRALVLLWWGVEGGGGLSVRSVGVGI